MQSDGRIDHIEVLGEKNILFWSNEKKGEKADYQRQIHALYVSE